MQSMCSKSMKLSLWPDPFIFFSFPSVYLRNMDSDICQQEGIVEEVPLER